MYFIIVFCLLSPEISLWYLGTFHMAGRVSVGLVRCSYRRSWTVGDLPLKGSSRSPRGKQDPGRTAEKAGSAHGGGGKPGPSPTLRSHPARSRTAVSHTAGRCMLEDTDNGCCSHTRRRFDNAEVRCRTLGLWHWKEKGKQKTTPLPNTHTHIGYTQNKYEHFYDYIELSPEISYIHLLLKIDRNSQYKVQAKYWLKWITSRKLNIIINRNP